MDGPDLDYVVFFEKPFVKFERLLMTAVSGFPRTYMQFVHGMRSWLFDKLWIRSRIESALGVDRKRILFSDHHVSHAASAYFCSPFDRAATLTFDGVGEWATATIGIGEGHSLSVKRELRFPHSLGLLYSAFTAFLGFEVNEGEYKVMGMAPYGTPRYADRIWEIVRAARRRLSVDRSPLLFVPPQYAPLVHVEVREAVRQSRAIRTFRSSPGTPAGPRTTARGRATIPSFCGTTNTTPTSPPAFNS